MKSSFFYSTILFFVVFLGSTQASVLREVRKQLKGHESFEVRFQQTVEQEMFEDRIESVNGVLEFNRPNRFIWKYQEPEKAKKIIEFNGKHLIVDGEKVQTAEGVRLEEAFSFLWGKASSEIFDLKPISKNKLRLQVKEDVQTSFKKIDLQVKDGLISKAEVFDRFGGRSILQFSNWKLH